MRRKLFSTCARKLSPDVNGLSYRNPRSHFCNQLSEKHIGQRVTLAGWITSERKLSKSAAFFSLRDSTGAAQLITTHEALKTLRDIPLQSVVSVQGTVAARPQSAQRKDASEQIEIQVTEAKILNLAQKNLPFDPSDSFNLAHEELRLRHRYLDLRRNVLTQNLHRRSRVAHHVRNYLHEKDFTEVETPLLLKSTPEGAREFLVPAGRSRVNPNANDQHRNLDLFYALPQSPQQPKQLLICSGAVDKYYQLARCFRDEDGRKDRQPEFTQVDLEMGFVSWTPTESERANGWRIGGGEIKSVVEGLMQKIWHELEAVGLPSEFPVMTYHHVMSKYGCDKPDTRYGLEIQNLSDIATVRQESSVLEAIVVKKQDHSWCLDASTPLELNDFVHKVSLTEGNFQSWLSSASTWETSLAQHDNLNERLGLQPGDVVWLCKRTRVLEGGWTTLGRLRSHFGALAESKGLLPDITKPHFLWVTEFPLFTQADEDKAEMARGRWSSTHHPFTAPVLEDIPRLYNGSIEAVRGQHYDLVLNGVELGGGSVRVHLPEMQEFIFKNTLKLSDEELDSFSHLMEALRSGAPPHGGIALGFDRLLAMLCRSPSLKDVIAFPKTAGGVDPLFRSPSAFKVLS